MPAQAEVRRLCAASATLRTAPAGYVVARLVRPQRLRVFERTADGNWAEVRTSRGRRGWVLTNRLCPR